MNQNRQQLPPHYPRFQMARHSTASSFSSSGMIEMQDFSRRSLGRLNAQPADNFEKHADKIVEKLELEEELLNDTPLSEQLRKEALRDLPQGLTMKRCVKSKLSKSVSLKSKRRPISSWKRFKYRSSIKWTKFKDRITNFNRNLALWNTTLKEIEGHFGSGYASYFKFLRFVFIMNFFMAIPAIVFVMIPQILYDVNTNQTSQNIADFQARDLFIGGGSFYDTILFYGHYTEKNINLVLDLSYSNPAAYLATIFSIFLASFFILSLSVADKYRRNFIETEGGLKNVFANKIFCGWDFGVATAEAAELKSSAIYHELKELLTEHMKPAAGKSVFSKLMGFVFHTVTNLLILIFLGATGYGLWELLEEFSTKRDDTEVVVTSVIVNLVLTIYPPIFNYISKFEDYENPRMALYVNLLRNFLLDAVILGVILAFWLSKADSTSTECWETYLGQEMYRLLIFDFLFSTILNTVFEIFSYFFMRLLGKSGKFEFNIAKHSLQVIYNQALLWVSFFYSPIFSVLVVVKMLLLWYVRAICVQKFCKPPAKTWKAAQTETWFLVMTFAAILLAIIVQGYTANSISVSSTCGPFRDYNYTYEVVTDGLLSLEETSDGWKVLTFFTKPGVVTLFVIALSVLVYVAREKAFAEIERVKMLKEMLNWEAKDKEFLRKQAEILSNGQLMYENMSKIENPVLVLPHPENYNILGRETSSVERWAIHI